jgi:hypothetical protein
MQAPTEPRTFASERPVNIEPVPTRNVTLAKLAKGLNQTHACLEAHKVQTEERFRELRHAIKNVQASQAGLGHALLGREGERKKHPRIATMTSWQAGWRIAISTGSGLAAVFVIYRAAVAIWPVVWAFLKALNNLVLTARF